MHPVLFRGFFAIQQSVKPIVIGTLTTGLFLLFYFLLKGSFGAEGYLALPLAGSLAAIAMVVILLYAVAKEVGDLDFPGILRTLFQAAIGGAGSAAFAFLAFHFLPHHMSRLVGAVAFLFVATCAAWIYFFITSALKMPETEYVTLAMNRRRGTANQVPVVTEESTAEASIENSPD
jgi:peptidoglycan biosynthesis protein MviN/MurJ (putative lipid II flippase)